MPRNTHHHSLMRWKPIADLIQLTSCCRMLTALMLVLFVSTAAPGQTDLPPEVGDLFGLASGQLIMLDLDGITERRGQVEARIDGSAYTLDLRPNSVRADNFVFRVQTPEGLFVERKPDVERTVKGSIRGMQESRVIGAILDSGLSAKLVMGDGRLFFIEPVSSRMANNRFEMLHVVYRSTDSRAHGCQCGLEDHTLGRLASINEDLAARQPDQHRVSLEPSGNPDSGKQGGETDGGTPVVQMAELAVDADFEYFTDYGTEQATLDRMELIVNIVNDQYETDVDLTHVISAAIVRTSEPDPYGSTDSLALLGQFRSEWINNQSDLQRDLAHLFTGKEIDSNIIGRAWTIGGICNSSAYCLSQSDFNGNLGCATDLTAHELGHLWNGSHCNCSSHTMNPFITCSNNFNPNFTIPDIVSYASTLNCLDDAESTPPNDQWLNSVNIIDPDFSTTGTNISATAQADEQQLENTGSTVWWYFEADADGTVTIDTFGSGFDTQLHIYTGFELGFPNLIPVVDNNDTGGQQSQVSFEVTAGTVYEIRVGGFRPTGQAGSGAEGSIVLNGAFKPETVLIGDVNCDGEINLLDVDPFIEAIGSGEYNVKADTNQDGAVNLLDVDSFIALLGG